MSNAWESTTDDILNVIHKMGRKASSDQVETIFDSLDHFRIEDAALRGNDLETQTEYAYQEIERQIQCLDNAFKEISMPVQVGISAALKGLQQNKTYTLPMYGIKVEVSPDGAGTIQSGLKEVLLGEEPTESDFEIQGAVDALEALILGHACAGINIEAHEYVAGLTTALEAIANNL